MEELAALLGSNNKSQQDLVERLVTLLDRQTDHRLSPNVMIGFMGMFNLLSIMSVLRGNLDHGIREISSLSESSEPAPKTNDLQDLLSGLMKGQAGGGGQPDLLGLLGNLASKKKINPNLLLTLMGMLNSQMSQANSSAAEATPEEEIITVNDESEGDTEKKTAESNAKYERRAAGGR